MALFTQGRGLPKCRSTSWLARGFALLLVLAVIAPATAAPRLFVDDTGRSVSVPERPLRIVSLDDVNITVPLIELGVMPVGSQGRVGPGGHRFLRGSLILTGVDFDNSEIGFLGTQPVDVEAVAALKPDLIITLSHRPTPVAQLQEIAPTVVLDETVRSAFEIYGVLAELSGRQAEAAVLERRYQAQLAQLRSIGDLGKISVSVISATGDGKINIERTYGSFGGVLRDAGLRFPAMIDAIPDNRNIDVSPEALPELDADFVFDTYRGDKGETPLDAEARMAAILPDYCRFLSACAKGRYIVIPRDEAKAISYQGRSLAIGMLTSLLSVAGPAAGKP